MNVPTRVRKQGRKQGYPVQFDDQPYPADPLCDGSTPFDWESVARSMGEHEDPETRTRQAAFLVAFFDWLTGSRRGIGRPVTVWRRILVVRWYLDPTHKGRVITLTELARIHRIYPQELARISADFVRVMGVTSTRQRTRPSRIDKPARNATTTKGVGGRGGVG